MVQRLAPEKDSSHALKALVHLKDLNQKRSSKLPFSVDGINTIHLVIAGDGPARKSLEALVAKHDLPVTFLGNLKNDQLPPLYRAADVFITCSTSETYGK
eukprot:2807250-Pleurochrysis_carterae.AAC.1